MEGLKVGFLGVGYFVPQKVLTNADLEKMVDTSDEWITTRPGIKERRIAGDEVTQQLEDILAMTVRALTQEEGQYASQHPALERSAAIRQLREQVARAKIELAKRREEIAKSAGGTRLEMFSGDLSQIAIDSAEKQAQLDVLRGQIKKTQQELARASKFDPQAARIRIAKETLDIAERRVAELKTRLLNLQPPTVMMIGLN